MLNYSKQPLIVCNSVPKSGTHLLGHLFAVLGYLEREPGLNGALQRTLSYNPIFYFGYLLRTYSKPRILIDLDGDSAKLSVSWLCKYINESTGMYSNSHIPFSVDLMNLFSNYDVKVITIIRDPADIVNSFINYNLKNEFLPLHSLFMGMSELDRVATVLYGNKKCPLLLPLRSRFQRVQGWEAYENHIFVQFESLVGPKGGGKVEDQMLVVNRIASLCRIDDVDMNVVGRVFSSESQTFSSGVIGGSFKQLSKESLELIHSSSVYPVYDAIRKIAI